MAGMTEPTMPTEWQKLLIEQRSAKIRQANAKKEELKALEAEIRIMAMIAKIDSHSEEAV
jgi:hypothetical protein